MRARDIYGCRIATGVPECVIRSRRLSRAPPMSPPPPFRRRDSDEGEEGEYARVQLPDPKNREIFAVADALMGASRIRVVCADGKSRMGRIPGKMKKRMWIRPGDLVIVKPWDFQDDKCDVLFRYTRTQSVNLAKRRLLPESINTFST